MGTSIVSLAPGAGADVSVDRTDCKANQLLVCVRAQSL